MRKILAMLVAVLMLLTAAVAETSAPYAPETVLPLVANNRPYRDFARGAISSSEDAIEQAKAWLYLPLFVTNFPRSPKLSIGLPCARKRDGM